MLRTSSEDGGGRGQTLAKRFLDKTCCLHVQSHALTCFSVLNNIAKAVIRSVLFFFILFLNPPTDSVPLFTFLHPICFLPPPSSLLRDRGRICCRHLKLRLCWWFPSRILQRASKSAGSRGIDTNKTITCGEQHSGFEQQQKTHKLIIIITNPSNSQSRCTCVCGEQLEVCASVPQLFTHVTEDETLSTN